MTHRQGMLLGAAVISALAFAIPSRALDGWGNGGALTVDISQLGSTHTDTVVVLAHPVEGNPWRGPTHRFCEWRGENGEILVGEAKAQSGSTSTSCVISGINDLAPGSYVVDAAVFSQGAQSPSGCSSVVLEIDGPSEVSLPTMTPCI